MADTTTAHGRLRLTVLGGLAEFERELIRARTGEGRARAVARGVKMGRRPKLTDHQKRKAIKRRDHGEETLADIGQSYNVSGWTISRLTGRRGRGGWVLTRSATPRRFSIIYSAVKRDPASTGGCRASFLSTRDRACTAQEPRDKLLHWTILLEGSKKWALYYSCCFLRFRHPR